MMDKLNPISLHVFALISAERVRQYEKFGTRPIANRSELVSITGEEFGEIARAVNQDLHEDSLRAEVIQLAAVCIAYLDGDLHFGNEQ